MYFVISTRASAIPALILILSYAITAKSSSRLYARYIRDMQDLERFDLKIAKHLTISLLSADNLPIGSEIRRLVELYVRDFYQSIGYPQVKDVITWEDIHLSKYPVCAYRMIRRVKVQLQDLMAHKGLPQILGPVFRKTFLFFWKTGWPVSDDMETLMEKILRLQLVYDFDVEQFSNGWISNSQTNCSLLSVHCYEIGNRALKSDQYSSAIEWLQLAKKKALVDKKIGVSFVEFSLWNAIEKHNEGFDEEIKLDLEPVYFDREIRHIPDDTMSARKLRNLQYETFRGNTLHHDNLLYLGLCSGDNSQSEKEKSYLFCWYEFKAHPSFLIGPRKIEFLARNPDVVQIYEMVHAKEIKAIVSNAGPKMFESKTSRTSFDFAENRAKDSKAVNAYYRTSVNAWYWGPQDRVLSRRIEQVTGLKVVGEESSELLQVASYSFGGHYFPHLDQFGFAPQAYGQYRIATFMFYFNDVEEGGGTAFSLLGVAAKPVKGSAVFWYNLYADGGSDYATSHGACPVLVGEKWAANKWIKSSEQFLIRKCGLKQRERYEFAVNNVYLPTLDVRGDPEGTL